jgi:predicted nucleotidyltransferase
MDEIQIMLKIKANSDEKDLKPRMPVIHNYIQEEIKHYEQISKEMEDDRSGDWSALNQVFLKVLGED